ncbi:hypothetical protein GGF50DRAFT_93078 [Schizophyllum commune]
MDFTFTFDPAPVRGSVNDAQGPLKDNDARMNVDGMAPATLTLSSVDALSMVAFDGDASDLSFADAVHINDAASDVSTEPDSGLEDNEPAVLQVVNSAADNTATTSGSDSSSVVAAPSTHASAPAGFLTVPGPAPFLKLCLCYDPTTSKIDTIYGVVPEHPFSVPEDPIPSKKFYAIAYGFGVGVFTNFGDHGSAITYVSAPYAVGRV